MGGKRGRISIVDYILYARIMEAYHTRGIISQLLPFLLAQLHESRYHRFLPDYKETAMEQLQTTEFNKDSIQKVSYTHDSIIDWMIANPRAVTRKEIGIQFGYSEVWMNRLVGSDAFQARLAKRREELIDPILRNSVEENMRGLAQLSLDVLMDKLASERSPEIALRTLDMTSRAIGYGARETAGAPKVSVNFVVAMPDRVADVGSWANAHNGRVVEG